MAGLQGVASVIGPVLQGIGIVSGIVDTADNYRSQRQAQELALRELQQKQAAELRVARENADLEREKITLQSEVAEKGRRDALKRAASRQRAKFGGSGIESSSSSSAQAVLLGLYDESEGERLERESLDNLRNRALDSNLAQIKRLNVLQQTQLRERQKLGDLSSRNSLVQGLLGNVGSLIGQ